MGKLNLLSVISSLLVVSTPINASGDACPIEPIVRAAEQLSANEREWMEGRDKVSKDRLLQWLIDSNLTDFDVERYFSDIDSVPRMGIGLSGGGYRAMLSGAGALMAMDERMGNQSAPGYMGGLLQSASYIAGISGGSWLLCSLAANNFIKVPDILGKTTLWNFTQPFKPAQMISAETTGKKKDGDGDPRSWIWRIFTDTMKKTHFGPKLEFIDLWSDLVTSNTLLKSNDTDSDTWSGILNRETYQNKEFPFPIVVADGLDSPSYDVPPLNATEYEFTPFEFGSWDPSIYAFTPMECLGAVAPQQKLSFFSPAKFSPPVSSYDDIGFVMATSSTIFSGGITQLLNAIDPDHHITDKIKDLSGPMKSLINIKFDAPVNLPNPFLGLPWVSDELKDQKNLRLCDGGLNGENIPLNSLFRPEREMDVVIALDNSADFDNWPNGYSLYHTYMRQKEGGTTNGGEIPYIPTLDELRLSKFANGPVFFGCRAPNSSTFSPLLVYIPNNYMSYPANFPTFKLSYTDEQRNGVIQNGADVLTRFNGYKDPEWRQCMSCAIILREQQRRSEIPTVQCEQCFSRYCFTNDEYVYPDYQRSGS